MVHKALADMAQAPEFAIDDISAKELTVASVELMAQYGGVFNDPKQVAWMKLIMVAGSVYGTRAIMYAARRDEERKRPKQPITARS